MTSRKKAPKALKSSITSRHHDIRFMGPSSEDIRLRAYEIYVGRGRADGQDLEDWFQAEKELIEIDRGRTTA